MIKNLLILLLSFSVLLGNVGCGKKSGLIAPNEIKEVTKN